MNSAHIYGKAVGRVVKTKEDEDREAAKRELEKDPVSIQSRIDWLNNTNTKEFASKLGMIKHELIMESIALACTFHQHQNPHKIIDNLIRANNIQQSIDQMNI